MCAGKHAFTGEEYDKLQPLVDEITRFASIEDGMKSSVHRRPFKKDVRIDLDQTTYDRLRKQKEKFSNIHIQTERTVINGVEVEGLESGIVLLKLE